MTGMDKYVYGGRAQYLWDIDGYLDHVPGVNLVGPCGLTDENYIL